jgi:hypothetical protein
VTIPDRITTIGNRAFAYCSSLVSVNIPDSITTLGSAVFEGCRSLQYASYENCKYLGNANNPYLVLMTANEKNLSTYTIHNDTKIIAESAFSRCTNMTTITIPDSVTTIGDFAFSGCYGLTSVTFGNKVTIMAAGVFYDCGSLIEIHFNGTKEQWQTIEKHIYWNYSTGQYTIHCTDGEIKK